MGIFKRTKKQASECTCTKVQEDSNMSQRATSSDSFQDAVAYIENAEMTVYQIEHIIRKLEHKRIEVALVKSR